MNQRPLFYRGDLDDSVVTAPNGARVNRDYATFVESGPWSEVKTLEITPRIHVVTGYGLPNYTFIEGDTGLILIDTGLSYGMGLEVLKMKEKFSVKPVVAVIYSHFHYTRGTRAVLESWPDRDIPIYGHPDVDKNLLDNFSYMAPANFRRGAAQFGALLPKSGPDAAYAIEEPHFGDPELDASGHVPVTHPVDDGEKVVIDGLDFVFRHAVADTEDSLVIHVPALETVVHNTAVMPFLFPMYTLRGDYYRSMPDVLDGVDLLRSLRPEHLIGCHGIPVSGKQEAHAFATAHRDALAFVFQQTIRGINQGLTPDEIARRVALPAKLSEIPELFPAYVDVEHMVRGVYRGVIGWWAEDTAELHPPSPAEVAEEFVDAFGGVDLLAERANEVLQEARYNLAAKLAAYALAHDPDHVEARRVKAAALRKMAQSTPTGIQTRNFLLTEALRLEGAIAANGSASAAPVDAASLAGFPPETLLQSLVYTIDASQAADLVATIEIVLRDVERSYTVAVRHGAVELTQSALESSDLTLTIDRLDWARMMLGQARLEELVEEGQATFTGDASTRAAILAAYHEFL